MKHSGPAAHHEGFDKSNPHRHVRPGGSRGGFQTESGIDLQHFLNLLQRQRKFLFFAARARAVHQLPRRFLPDALIELHPQNGHFRVDMTLGLEFGQNLGRELQVAFRLAFLLGWLRRASTVHSFENISSAAGFRTPLSVFSATSLLVTVSYAL